MDGDDRAGDERDGGLLGEPLAAELAVEAALLSSEQLELRDLQRRGGGGDVGEAELEDADAPLVLDGLEPVRIAAHMASTSVTVSRD